MYFRNNYVLLCLILCVRAYNKNPSLNKLNYTNIYGDNYGTDWIFMPDGDGIPHYVNLKTFDLLFERRGSGSHGDIEFRLYKGNDTETYILLNEQAEPIQEVSEHLSYVLTLRDKPLKIVTHGWKSSVDNDGVTRVKNAYLESERVNVITVDWSGIAGSILYHWVANEINGIGTKVATFINQLYKKYELEGKQFHLIGHSLGAHIMGIAASRAEFTVDRITGLDPARPLFEFPLVEHLSKIALRSSNARFVDVIHTCGGVLGYESPIGTVDFFPNGGMPPQLGCESIQKMFESCSHGRAFHYFSESIEYPWNFPAYQCRSWLEYVLTKCGPSGYMGEFVSRHMKGTYYLRTNSSYPYGYFKRSEKPKKNDKDT